MKSLNRRVLFGVSVVIASLVVYLIISYAIVKDLYDVLGYLVRDLAILPIVALVVRFLIDRVMGEREKRRTLNKMNMVIGVFFSDVGTKLLKCLSRFDRQADQIRRDLLVTDVWSDEEFMRVSRQLAEHDYSTDSRAGDLEELRALLFEKGDFLLRLLENPHLLEHESFTNLLWAVFHLYDELAHRENVRELSDADYTHLSGDMRRAYSLLIAEWLIYMRHLRHHYPYLFSLAIRTNPFDPEASAGIR